MSESKWGNKQLLLQAESMVVGRYGVYPTYKVLEGIRDDMQATIDALRDELATLQAATQGVPVEIAETLKEALSVWIVNIAMDHALGHVSLDDRKECDQRHEIAIKWLTRQRKGGE